MLAIKETRKFPSAKWINNRGVAKMKWTWTCFDGVSSFLCHIKCSTNHWDEFHYLLME